MRDELPGAGLPGISQRRRAADRRLEGERGHRRLLQIFIQKSGHAVLDDVDRGTGHGGRLAADLDDLLVDAIGQCRPVGDCLDTLDRYRLLA